MSPVYFAYFRNVYIYKCIVNIEPVYMFLLCEVYHEIKVEDYAETV